MLLDRFPHLSQLKRPAGPYFLTNVGSTEKRFICKEICQCSQRVPCNNTKQIYTTKKQGEKKQGEKKQGENREQSTLSGRSRLLDRIKRRATLCSPPVPRLQQVDQLASEPPSKLTDARPIDLENVIRLFIQIHHYRRHG